MSGAEESHVGLAQEGTGPQVRTRKIPTWEDGAESTAEQQTVGIADLRDGGVPRVDEVFEQMLGELKEIREMLELALSGLKLR